MSPFARLKFRGFLHSFFMQGWGCLSLASFCFDGCVTLHPLEHLGDGAPLRTLPPINPPRRLARAAAEGSISLGGGAFGEALGAAAELAELRGHPLLRAEETFQKCWQIEVRVQFREVNAEARRADFDLAERCGRGGWQPLSETPHNRSERTPGWPMLAAFASVGLPFASHAAPRRRAASGVLPGPFFGCLPD